MKEMMKRLSGEIDSMHTVARKVIKHGFQAFLVIMLISLVMTILNKQLYGNIYDIAINSMYMFKASFSVLAITVIGGLIMDFVSKKG